MTHHQEIGKKIPLNLESEIESLSKTRDERLKECKFDPLGFSAPDDLITIDGQPSSEGQ